MGSFYNDASLVMIPSGYKDQKVYCAKPADGSGDLVFSRASSATRVQSNGLIEKVRTNEIRNSTMVGAAAPSTLPTNWNAINNGITFTVIGTGTEYGYTYLDVNASGTATSTNARIGFDSATQIVATTGQYWTNSFYFKKISETAAPVAYQIATFENTIAGTIVVSNVANFTPTTTLARYSYSLLTAGGATIARVQPFVRFSTNPTASYDFTFRIAATQMEQGDVATDYIPTTTAAVSVGPVSGLPRLDYYDSTCPKLLLEPQRSNLVTFSENIDNAAWTKIATTATANTTTSPDGTLSADTVLSNGVSTLHVAQTNTISFTTSTAYSFTVFAKKGTNNFIQLIAASGVGGMFANFDLNTGVVGTLGTVTGTNPTSSIQDYGNGWYRCALNFTATATTGQVASIAIVTSASAARAESNTLATSIFLWGCQLEVGAYPTSYIPTLAASVTRVADAASKTGITSLIGQTEGVVFVEFNNRLLASYPNEYIVQIISGTTQLWLRKELAGNSFTARLIVSGTTIWTFASLIVPINGNNKIAIAYKTGNSAVFLNGAQVSSTNTSAFSGSAFADLNFNFGGTLNPELPLSQALLFKTRLSNAALQELTTL
jgi:hypothetical protein